MSVTSSTSISLADMKQSMKKHEFLQLLTRMYSTQRVAFDTSSEEKQAQHATNFAVSQAKVLQAHCNDISLVKTVNCTGREQRQEKERERETQTGFENK
eukprot:3292157-Rhodomonas_salina.1